MTVVRVNVFDLSQALMMSQEIWFKTNCLFCRWRGSYSNGLHGFRSSDWIQIRERTVQCVTRKQSYQISRKFWYV